MHEGLRTSSRSVSLSAGVVAVLASQSPRRCGVIFFPAGATYTVAPDGITPALGVGWSIEPGSQPITLYNETHGDIVARNWSAYCASNVSVLVGELFSVEN